MPAKKKQSSSMLLLLPKKKIKKPSSARLDGIVNKLTSAARLREEKGDGSPVKKMPIQSKMKRKNKCSQCDNCKRANCGSCISCQDMPRFGGPGKMKQACKLRKCLASVSTVSNTSLASVSAVGHRVQYQLFRILELCFETDCGFQALPVAANHPVKGGRC